MTDAEIAESDAFDAWWREHYSMAHLARGAAEDAWRAAILAERQRCAKVCRDMATFYEAAKEESVNWEARAGELRWVAGLIDGSAPPPDVRSAP